jgi:ABC-2 type transport system permease protein
MTRLFGAELVKLRTVRSTWGFLLVALLFAGLIAAGNIGGTAADDRLDPELQYKIVLDTTLPASILAILIGILLVTNEFRHGTIARTLLATPRRWKFVAIKLLVGGFTGAVLMTAMLAAVLVTASIWLGIIDVPIAPGQLADGAWRALLVVAVAGLFGAAIGGAVHSQVGALVGALLWMFVLEPICWVVLGLLDLDGVSEYLPAAALGSAVDSTSGAPLSWGSAVLVACAWAGLASAVALFRTGRRDIT